MKEKWLSVQESCKFKYHASNWEYCSLGRQGIYCNMENCQIFKFAEALLPKSEPEPIKLPTLYEFWSEGVNTVSEACTNSSEGVGNKKVGFWYNNNNSHKLKIKKCEYISDTIVYHLEDY